MEHHADFKEKVCVNAIAAENLVDVRAVAVELIGEPNNGALLLAEFFLYFFSNNNLAHTAFEKAEPERTYLLP